MVLSAALDKGYIFMAIVAILTSVIGGIYYLNIIKEIFFHSSEYEVSSWFKNISLKGNIYNSNNKLVN